MTTPAPTRRSHVGGLWRGVPLLVLPAVILVAGTMVWAVGNVIVTSLRQSSLFGAGLGSWIGLDNYKTVLSNPDFLSGLGRALLFTVVSVIGQISLALVLALLTWSDHKAVKVVRAALAVPWAISPVIVAIIWRFIYLPGASPLADWLGSLGLTQGILASTTWAFWALIVVNIWQFTPLYMLFVGAGLRSIAQGELDAAALDGAGKIRQVWFIVLPHVRGLLVTLAIFNTLSTMGLFDLIWTMTKGGPDGSSRTASVLIYQTAFERYDLGTASAAVVVMTLAGSALVVCLAGLRRRVER